MVQMGGLLQKYKDLQFILYSVRESAISRGFSARICIPVCCDFHAKENEVSKCCENLKKMQKWGRSVSLRNKQRPNGVFQTFFFPNGVFRFLTSACDRGKPFRGTKNAKKHQPFQTFWCRPCLRILTTLWTHHSEKHRLETPLNNLRFLWVPFAGLGCLFVCLFWGALNMNYTQHNGPDVYR